MLFIIDALKISVYRVIVTIINLFVFKTVYHFTKKLLNGYWAFFGAIYFSAKVKSFLYSTFKSTQEKLLLKINPKFVQEKFDPRKLEAIDLKEIKSIPKAEIINNFLENVKNKSMKDLFSFIFRESSDSAMLSIITLFGIEYMSEIHSILYSIFFVVGIAFVICLGSSLRYAFILINEWRSDLEQDLLKAKDGLDSNSKSNNKNILIAYNQTEGSEKSKNTDYVCLWSSSYDQNENINYLRLKFFSTKYSDDFIEVVKFYGKNYLSVESNAQTSVDELEKEKSKKFKNLRILVPEYYGRGFGLVLKDNDFKQVESWKEFSIFPSISFEVASYQYKEKNKKIN